MPVSTFDLRLVRLTAGTAADATDPVATQDASAFSPFEVKAVEGDAVKPMSFEFVYYWVLVDGTTITTNEGLGSAQIRVGKVTEAIVGTDRPERVQANPTARTVVMGEPFLIDDVLDGDKVFVIFDATTPTASANKIRVEGRAQPEEN